MDKVEQVIQGLLADEEFDHAVQEEFTLNVLRDDDGPVACFNACGSFVTVRLLNYEQAAQLFVGFQGIEKIIDVD